MAPRTSRRTASYAWKPSGAMWKPKAAHSALIGVACVVAAAPPLDEEEKDEAIVHTDSDGETSVGDGVSTRATAEESDGERSDCGSPPRRSTSFSSDSDESPSEEPAAAPPAPAFYARETLLRLRAGLASGGALAPSPVGGGLHVAPCPQKVKVAEPNSWSKSREPPAAKPPVVALSWAGSWEDDAGKRERSIKSVLNKLTPEKFDKLYPQLLACGAGMREHCDALAGEIFEKAVLQHSFAAMYADLCARLVSDDEEGRGSKLRGELLSLFKRHIEISLCPPTDGCGDGDEEARAVSKKRAVGGFRFGGELLSRGLIPSTELLLCAQDLVKLPVVSEKLEACAVLLTVTGPAFDQESWAQHGELKELFSEIERLSLDQAVPTRARYLLRDLLELRAAGWRDGKAATRAEGPKRLEEVRDGGGGSSPKAQAVAQASVLEGTPSGDEAARPRPANLRTCTDILGMGMCALQYQQGQAEANESSQLYQCGPSEYGADAMWSTPMQFVPMMWVPMTYMPMSSTQSSEVPDEQVTKKKKPVKLVNRRVDS